MMTRLIRNSAFGLIGSVTTTLGSFVSGLIVARTLGVEGAGEVAFAIFLATTAVTLASAGIPFTLGRYLPELTAQGDADEAARLNAFLLKPYLMLAITAPALMLLYALMTDPHFGKSGAGVTHTLWIVIAACALTQSAADFARGHLRGMQKFDTVAMASFVAALIQPVAIFFAGRHFGSAGALSGYVVGNAIPALLIFAIPRPTAAVSPALRRRVLRYAGYRWATEIMGAIIWSRMEIFFLQVAGGGSVPTGLFSAGLTLANLVVQLPVMLTCGLIPHFSEQVGRKEFNRMRQDFSAGTRIMAFVLLPSCFGLSAIMPALVPVLYGPQFAEATNVAIILVCGAASVASTTVAANVIAAVERTDVEFRIGLAGAVLALVLDITIIPRYGPMGAAFCRVVVQSFVGLMTVGFVVRKLHYPLPVLELGKIFLSALACALAARLSLLLVPGAAGLPLAIGLGAIVYLISVRYCGALPEGDIARFRSLAALLPSALAGPAHRVLNAMAPRKPVIASGIGSPDL